MGKLKIEYVPTESLKTYANNAKIHTAEQIEQIKKSIREFSFNDPIAVWKDNEIIEGHGRLIAALELGIEELPIIRLDNLTDEQRKAYMLVHNKLTMNTDFDLDVLNEELESISDFEMENFGFDLTGFIEDEAEEKEEGEVPFTEELLLTHNYIVLYFDNDFDWEVAQEKFGLRQVKDLIPRKGQPKGIGRVINGKEVLNWQS
jgi:hypothetical protein